MVSPVVRPGAGQRCEVDGVVGDEDSLLAGCQLEHVLVVDRPELGFGVKRDDVVTPAAKESAYAVLGEVLVEQQPHARGAAACHSMNGYSACHSSSVRLFAAIMPFTSSGCSRRYAFASSQ